MQSPCLDSSNTGRVYINNNTVVIDGSTQNRSGFSLQAFNGSTLIIDNIENNQITSLNATASAVIYGIEILADSSDITVSNGIRKNVINISNELSNNNDGIYIQAQNQGAITINNGISNNIIDSSAVSSISDAITMGASDSNSTLIINGGMKNNNLTTANNGWAVDFFGGGVFTINGGFINNTAYTGINSDRSVNFGNNAAGTVSINDGFYDNNITLDSSSGIAAVSIGYISGTYVIHVGEGKGSNLVAANNIVVTGSAQQLQTIGNVTITE